MKKFVFVLAIIACPASAHAQKQLSSSPSRVRLAIHSSVELQKEVKLVGHFLPSPDLMTGLSPLAYLELKWSPTKWISISPTVGYDFGLEDFIVSVRATTHIGKRIWAWFDFEWSVRSDLGYSFLQVDVKALKWLSAGLEYEFWGKFGKADTWSLGGGPDIIIHLGKIDLELATHFRKVATGVAVEFVMRAHIFLF